jgi:hypothetical protein
MADLYNVLRKEIFQHKEVMRMLVPPELHSELCKRYLGKNTRPSEDVLKGDARYLISIGAEL